MATDLVAGLGGTFPLSTFGGVTGPQANSSQDIPAPLHRLPRNISLQLTPNVRLWFDGGLFAGVRFALVIRRGN